MARKDELIKSKSIYTIRKKHTTTTAGTIYENDFTTIVSNDDIYDDNMVLFSDSNFKYRVNRGNGNKKRHIKDTWVKTKDNKDVWTKESLSDYIKSEETQIINKPNYSTIKDFAYYGSAVELIKATVNDVILRFPGGLSYYDENYAPKVTIESGKFKGEYDVISNEFGIDCWTVGDVFSGSVKNPMRILAASYYNYVDKDGKQTIKSPKYTSLGTCINSIVGKVDFGLGEFLVYMDGEFKNHLLVLSSKRKGKPAEILIRPKQDIIEDFWRKIDDFERVLLNRTTNPIYKASFETPYQTEDGFFYTVKDYVWPTVEADGSGFTPDITTSKFQGYLHSLIELAQFHDEYDSDNILRMMTHESIKNLDWSFISSNETEGGDTIMDSSRAQAILNIWGRQFDDLKRYAENVKSSSNISYDEKNNIPDYFLSDVVDIDGWEAKSVAPSEDTKENTSEIIYKDTMSMGYKPSEANINFLRRLALNSDFIQSLKGTRTGLESVLHLFGYEEDVNGNKSAGTYTISEYVRVANNKLPYRKIGYLRATCDYVFYDENTNLMDGYPVIVLDPSEDNDESKYYLMPWHNKYIKYKYPIYFQSRGGWGKLSKKNINLPSLTSATSISDTYIYGETEPYMKYADNISEMLSIPNDKLEEEMICYVIDITGMSEYNQGPETTETSNYSHYFVLKKLSLSNHLGYMDEGPMAGCYGWKNIYNPNITDPDQLTQDGKRVIYLESILAEYRGNNPHIGKGKYDDGDEYLSKFSRLFGDAIDEGIYDKLRDSSSEDWNSLINAGFNVDTIVECNNKCQFFYGDLYTSSWAASAITGEKPILIDESKYNKYYNPEDETPKSHKYTEISSYSVINVKNILITFNTNGNHFLKDYITNVVLKYLEPMIPSTSIVKYAFDDDKKDTYGLDSFEINTNSTKIIAHAAIPENDTTYFTDSEYYDNYIRKK